MNPDRLQFLAQSIAKAKRVMDKVETGKFSTGHVNTGNLVGEEVSMPTLDSRGDMMEMPVQKATHMLAHAPAPAMRTNSKMPAAILESFRNNPGMGVVDTSDPLAINNMQMDQLAQATKQAQGTTVRATQGGLTAAQRRQLEEQYNPTNGFTAQQVAQPQWSPEVAAQVVQQPSFTQQLQYAAQPQGTVLSEDYVKYLIEKTVESTVKATVEAVMEQLNKPTTIDENIQIRIGGKVFGGKIQTLKS